MLKKKIDLNQNNYDQTNRVYDTDGICPTITTPTGGGHMPKIEVKAILTPGRKNKSQNGRQIKNNGEPMFTLTGQEPNGVEVKTSNQGVLNDTQIRRLTPTECERLQGFPDGWTKKGCEGETISDSQRYKTLGNAVTTNVVKAIGERLLKKGP